LTYKGKTFTDSDNAELTKAFRQVYKGALALWVNDIDPKAKPSGSVEIKFVFTNKTQKETVTIEYIKKDETRYYIMKNGKYTGLVSDIRNVDKGAEEVVPGIRSAVKAFVEKYNTIYSQ
jgi:hypothetical protein